MMSSGAGTSLVEHFSSLADPRRPQGRRHNLLDIITMTIYGVVAGAAGWDDVELFVQCKAEWFRRFNGSADSWSCPMASPAPTPLPGCLPASTRTASGTASGHG